MLDVSAGMQVDRLQRGKPEALDVFASLFVPHYESVYGELRHAFIIGRRISICTLRRGNVLNVYQRTERKKIICYGVVRSDRQRPVRGSTTLQLTQEAAPNWAAWE